MSRRQIKCIVLHAAYKYQLMDKLCLKIDHHLLQHHMLKLATIRQLSNTPFMTVTDEFLNELDEILSKISFNKI